MVRFTEKDFDELQTQAEIQVEAAYQQFLDFFAGDRAAPAMNNAPMDMQQPPEPQQGAPNG